MGILLGDAHTTHGPPRASQIQYPNSVSHKSSRPLDMTVTRIPAVELSPVVEGGRLPAKATAGEPFPIRATVFREGHDAYQAEAVLIDPDGHDHTIAPMVDIAPGLDRYEAWVMPDRPGNWSFCIQTWSDPYATWRHDATIKVDADIDADLMLEEGARLFERMIEGRTLANSDQQGLAEPHARVLHSAISIMRDATRSNQQRLSAGISSSVRHIVRQYPLRDLVGRTEAYPLHVARTRALVGSWYEIFPRSAGAFQRPDGTWVSGTLRTAIEELDRISAMGFDVIYLTPVHPIGTTFRKGKNNTLNALETDPGSPYGIGSDEGGHDAIHPDLGDFDDFDAFVAAAYERGMEVALDFALQCSPDHPWVRDHPEWFSQRADGSIAYAENPPKKYQDIYPINFDHDPEGLFEAIHDLFRLWIAHGVKIFRVDNPHTKPVNFWKRMMDTLHREYPDVICLAEAFTRPAMMRTLGAVGFDQSYTYFAWRTYKKEIEEYLKEVSEQTPHLMRPTFWPTTHDILTPQMTEGGTAMFAIRAILAACGAPTWGIYSGYELVESVPRPGFEEQINNEKYEYRPRRWEDAERTGIPQLLTLLNTARGRHRALQQLHQISIHRTSNDQLLCFSRHIPGQFTPDGNPDTVIVVVSLDPHHEVWGSVDLDVNAPGMELLNAGHGGGLNLVDELDGMEYRWGASNVVRLSPWTRIGHVFGVEQQQ